MRSLAIYFSLSRLRLDGGPSGAGVVSGRQAAQTRRPTFGCFGSSNSQKDLRLEPHGHGTTGFFPDLLFSGWILTHLLLVQLSQRP
jgi:hypothetical protein